MIEAARLRQIGRKTATDEIARGRSRQNTRGVFRHANREAHRRVVTIGAWRRSRHVSRRLAACDSAIVAGHAFCRRLQMIYDLDVGKERRLVASGAFQGRRRVIWRFADCSVAIVARRTGIDSVLVLPVKMTSLAGSLRVRAGKRESCLRMIERAFQRLSEIRKEIAAGSRRLRRGTRRWRKRA